MPEVTTLDIVTLVTAIVGAVSGVGALLWGVSQYWLVGPRITVVVAEAWVGAGILTGPEAWTRHRNDGQFPVPAVAVEVVNKGRQPTTITSVEVVLSNGLSYRDLDGLGISPPLSYRLDAHEAATWLVEFRAVWASVETSREVLGTIDRVVTARVKLATGKAIRSGQSIRIPGGMLAPD